MGEIIVFINVTLNRVMQALARLHDDTRGDFYDNGWGAPYAAMTFVMDRDTNTDTMLLGW
jgi:hypothetical protein